LGRLCPGWELALRYTLNVQNLRFIKPLKSQGEQEIKLLLVFYQKKGFKASPFRAISMFFVFSLDFSFKIEGYRQGIQPV
jgi:hypothetical protein